MKHGFNKIACGFAAATLAISLVACDDSSSSPSNDDLIEPSSETITSSETTGNSADAKSSDSNEKSATSQNGNSSTSQEGGSSAATGTSSNSSAGNSSNSEKTCDHITDNECRITQGCAMTPCMDGTKAFDCATKSDYVCKGGTWQVAESCTHLSDVEGSNKWTSTEPEFTITKDCSNGFYYMSVEERWVKVDDCDPSKERCGFDNYKMCRETRLKQFCIDNSWVNEPCDPEVHGYERTLYTYDEPNNPQITSFSQMRYFCENGKWISESEVYNCDPMKDCAGIGY